MRNELLRAMIVSLAVCGVRATLTCGQARQPLPAPTEKRVIYSENVDAKAEIAEALGTARKTHKRVILVFGGNWCYDCHVLDTAFRSAGIAPLGNKNFVVAHVKIRAEDKKLCLSDSDDVTLKSGVGAGTGF